VNAYEDMLERVAIQLGLYPDAPIDEILQSIRNLQFLLCFGGTEPPVNKNRHDMN
jgi:hypothetical protein